MFPNLWVRDASGQLFRLSGQPRWQEIGRLEYLTRTSAASVSAAGVLHAVEPASEERPARIVRFIGSRQEPEVMAELRGSGRRAFFGFGGRLSSPRDWGLVAVEHESEGSWQIFGASAGTFLTPFTGTQVVGIGRDPQQPGSPGLLLLAEDWRTLLLAGRNWSRKVATAASEIEHVAVHHASPRFAYATAAGENQRS